MGRGFTDKISGCHARRAYREVRTRIARINAFLQEHITGMVPAPQS